MASNPAALMTIGELSRQSGLSVSAIRKYEARGLIYSAGRSPANYRLYDASALWCVAMIRQLRGLGLTLSELEQLTALYLEAPDRVLGPEFEAALDRAEERVGARIAELEAVRGRIRALRDRRAEGLTGTAEALLAQDPRRAGARP